MLSQLLHIHISLLPGKICIKNRMKFALLLELLQGFKTAFRHTTGFSNQYSSISFHLVWPKLISVPHSIIVLKSTKTKVGIWLCLLYHVPAYHCAQAAWKDFDFLNHIFQSQPASTKRRNSLSAAIFRIPSCYWQSVCLSLAAALQFPNATQATQDLTQEQPILQEIFPRTC